MNDALIEKLRKVMALTTSPSEGEAQAATAMLARLLKQHNLDVADLEKAGQAKPGVEETKIDLGKSAWAWKIQLAKILADHFFCIALERNKNPVFVGRPDNVASLQMLYTWLIGQVQEIARTERRTHHQTTGEHVDPLRWQLHFGLGAVGRLGERLAERRTAEASKAGTALVVSHATETSDYLEKRYGFRTDGRKTAKEQAEEVRRNQSMARWRQEDAARDALKARCEAAGDMEPYYTANPWMRPAAPKTEAEIRAEAKADAKRAKENDAWVRRERAKRERAAETEWRRSQSPEAHRRRAQAEQASDAGERAAERVNLEPFIECENPNTKEIDA